MKYTITELKNILKRDRFSFSVSLIALSLWLFSIEQAKLNLYEKGIGDIGLITILPITYFIAFTLLTLSFLNVLRSEKKNEKLLFFNVILLICFLFLTQVLVENSGNRLSASNYIFTDFISRNGYLDQERVLYHNWPGYFIFYAIIINISGISPETVIKAFPVFPNILFLPALLLFFDTVLTDVKRKWISIWMFYLGNWVYQDVFNAQNLAFFHFILILVLLIKFSEDIKQNKPSLRLLLILFFSSLVIGHTLSALAMMSIIIFFYIFKHYFNKYFMFEALILIASWNIYYATVFFKRNLAEYYSRSLEFDSVFGRGVTGRIIGSYGHMIVTNVSVIFTFLFIIFAFSGLLLSLRSGIKKIDTKILIASFAPLIIVSVYYDEGPMRVYLFAMLGLTYFISNNLAYKKIFPILVIFLLIAPTLHVIAHYGNEKWLSKPSGDINGANFFYSKVSYGYIVGGEDIGSFNKGYDYYLTKQIRKPEEPKETNDLISFTESLQKSKDRKWPLYLSINKGNKAYYTLFYNESKYFDENQIKIDNNINYNKIYINPDFELYLMK